MSILQPKHLIYDLIVGVDYSEGPPVPISNTVVKLAGAENTCLATDREDRLMPTLNAKNCLWAVLLLYLGIYFVLCVWLFRVIAVLFRAVFYLCMSADLGERRR